MPSILAEKLAFAGEEVPDEACLVAIESLSLEAVLLPEHAAKKNDDIITADNNLTYCIFLFFTFISVNQIFHQLSGCIEDNSLPPLVPSS